MGSKRTIRASGNRDIWKEEISNIRRKLIKNIRKNKETNQYSFGKLVRFRIILYFAIYVRVCGLLTVRARIFFHFNILWRKDSIIDLFFFLSLKTSLIIKGRRMSQIIDQRRLNLNHRFNHRSKEICQENTYGTYELASWYVSESYGTYELAS